MVLRMNPRLPFLWVCAGSELRLQAPKPQVEAELPAALRAEERIEPPARVHGILPLLWVLLEIMAPEIVPLGSLFATNQTGSTMF